MSSNRQSKRNAILIAATERFGRDGYEPTRWADIAADVGVGPTALYHYFESKQHCLFVVMDDAVERFLSRFLALASADREPMAALAAVLQDCFDLTEHEVLLNRILAAEQGRLATPSASPREEQARTAVLAHGRDLEFAWASFLDRAMREGAMPTADPRMLTRAIIGLYNSIWEWFRPQGVVALPHVAEFFNERALAMMGVAPEGVIRPRMVA